MNPTGLFARIHVAYRSRSNGFAPSSLLDPNETPPRASYGDLWN